MAGADLLTRAHEQVRDELRRADGKATTLLSLVGAALAGVVALAGRPMPVPAQTALWAAGVPIGFAVVVLLAAIRPRMGSGLPGTWLYAAQHGPETLLDALDKEEPEVVTAHHIARLGGMAVRKFDRIRLAITFVVTGLLLLALALVLGVATR